MGVWAGRREGWAAHVSGNLFVGVLGSSGRSKSSARETDVSNFDRIESKVDFFAGEPYDFSDARQWDVDF